MAYNDNRKSHPSHVSAVRRELRDWAESQRRLKVGPKAFLMRLASYVNGEGCAYVRSIHFQRALGVSGRSVTNYLRRLEAEGFIAATGNYQITLGARLMMYRVAPDREIGAYPAREAETPPAEPVQGISNRSTQSSKFGSGSGKNGEGYPKQNKITQSDGASPGAGASANFGVVNEAMRQAGLVPALEGLRADVLAAYRAEFGESRIDYLRQAAFAPATETLHPRTDHAVGKLREFGRHFFPEWKIAIGLSTKALGHG